METTRKLLLVFLIFSLHNCLSGTHNFGQQAIHAHRNLQKQYNLQASYSGVTVPSFHSIRISPRCKVGEECGKRMACSVSGALSLGTGDPGILPSGLGVYDFRTHTTFFLLAQQDRKRPKVGVHKHFPSCSFWN